MTKRMVNGAEVEISSRANLSRANLSFANLSRANLSGANLSFADLSFADLSFANLIGANLIGANLSDANLSDANLSRAKGLLNPTDYIKANFELITDASGEHTLGFYAYKTIHGSYAPPESWTIAAGRTISEVVNPLPTIDCACGVNVATLEWVKREHPKTEIWKVSIAGLQMASVVVPYNTDGKIRVGECTLVAIVEDS